MKYQEKKRHITLKEGYNTNLEGKVIDKVSLYRDCINCVCGELLITFTDNTFILLSPQWEEDIDEYILQDDYIQPISERSSIPGYVQDGKFRWDSQFQRYIDCGIVEFDTDIIKEWIEDAEKMREEREYAEYLRLKKKFENVDSKRP